MIWFKAELEKPRTAPWLVVIGHHPLYSNGVHGDDKTLISEWDELFKKHKVHFYFCGHDHDLQHLEFEKHPTSFVVSGGGGAKMREPTHERGPFAMGVYGFTHLEINQEKFIVRHFDANRKLLHAFAKKTDGSWALV
jgi:3',5'-cyclic AMP phosphodiesterase CpdA